MSILHASNIKPPPGSLIDPTHQIGDGVAYWFFNDGRGKQVTDAGPNGNRGTLTNMDPPTDWVAGPDGTILHFDGSDDRVRVSDTSSIKNLAQGAQGFSVIVRAYAATGINDNSWLATKRNTSGSTGGWGFRRHASNAFQLATVVISAPDALYRSSTSAYGLDEWHTFAGVLFGDLSGKLFIDGVEPSYAVQTSGSGADSDEAADLQIGSAYDFDGSQFWLGGIEFMYLYDRALTDDEMAWLYHEPYSMVIAPDPARFFSIPAVGYVPYPHKSGLGGGIGQIHGGKAA